MSYEAEQNRMIGWLAGQPPLVVDAAAQELNWDFAEEVIIWLLNQPTTDAATAARMFLMAEPSFYFPLKRRDGSVVTHALDSEIIKAIAMNWPRNFFARGNVGFKPRAVYGFILDELDDGEIKYRASGNIPWPELKGIEGPFDGPAPEHLERYFESDENELFRVCALYEDLGTEWSEITGQEEYRTWRLANGFGRKPNWMGR